jgi:hypothetical protein
MVRKQFSIYSVLLLTVANLVACGGGSEGEDDVGDGSLPNTLTWTPPTENTDGSSLEDLSKYRLYYGSSVDSLELVYEFDAGGSSLSFNALPSPEKEDLVDKISQNSTHFYAMTAVNEQNIESSYSGEFQY